MADDPTALFTLAGTFTCTLRRLPYTVPARMGQWADGTPRQFIGAQISHANQLSWVSDDAILGQVADAYSQPGYSSLHDTNATFYHLTAESVAAENGIKTDPAFEDSVFWGSQNEILKAVWGGQMMLHSNLFVMDGAGHPNGDYWFVSFVQSRLVEDDSFLKRFFLAVNGDLIYHMEASPPEWLTPTQMAMMPYYKDTTLHFVVRQNIALNTDTNDWLFTTDGALVWHRLDLGGGSYQLDYPQPGLMNPIVSGWPRSIKNVWDMACYPSPGLNTWFYQGAGAYAYDGGQPWSGLCEPLLMEQVESDAISHHTRGIKRVAFDDPVLDAFVQEYTRNTSLYYAIWRGGLAFFDGDIDGNPHDLIVADPLTMTYRRYTINAAEDDPVARDMLLNWYLTEGNGIRYMVQTAAGEMLAITNEANEADGSMWVYQAVPDAPPPPAPQTSLTIGNPTWVVSIPCIPCAPIWIDR